MSTTISETGSILRVTSILLTTIGSLVVAFAIMHMHRVMVAEKSFDDNVLKSMTLTRELSITGIVLLCVSSVLALSAEIMALTNLDQKTE
jgi:hypothetical protein